MKTEDKPIHKLPKWAQDYIKSLTHQRDDAQRELKEFLDSQTPSQFHEEFCGADRRDKRYIQAHSLVCEWRGVRLRISAHDYSNLGNGIFLQWEGLDHKEVGFIPHGHQGAHLRSIEDMR